MRLDERRAWRIKKPTKLHDSVCEDCGWAAYGWTTAAMAKYVLSHHRCPRTHDQEVSK